MGIQESISTCFSNYVTFQGRATRSEFWWWALFIIVVEVVVGGVGGAVMGDSSLPMIILLLFWLAVILPTIAVTVRRLHDTDHSGWWYWIALVPVIGGLWLLYFMVIGGTSGPNRFGGAAA